MSFEELYKNNYKTVLGYLIKLSKNKELAEELTAQTFLNALENFNIYKDCGKQSAWLCTIAKNEYFKHCKRYKNISTNTELETIYDSSDIEEMISDKDLALRIHKQLHSLSEPYKEVFVLRTFAVLSYKDIATVFKKNETWARVTYYRAKIKLLERMNIDE